MKKVFLIVIFVVTFLISCSCIPKNGEAYAMTEIDQNTILYTLNTKEYKFDELLLFFKSNRTMDEFYKEFKVENYKQIDGMKYTVLQTDMGMVFVSFDIAGNYGSMKSFCFSNDLCQNDIENVQIGSQIESVENFDPNGDYTFKCVSWTEYPQISYHYFTNGMCYAIRYNNGVVESITRFTI